jgi:hypothetical protein
MYVHVYVHTHICNWVTLKSNQIFHIETVKHFQIWKVNLSSWNYWIYLTNFTILSVTLIYLISKYSFIYKGGQNAPPNHLFSKLFSCVVNVIFFYSLCHHMLCLWYNVCMMQSLLFQLDKYCHLYFCYLVWMEKKSVISVQSRTNKLFKRGSFEKNGGPHLKEHQIQIRYCIFKVTCSCTICSKIHKQSAN